MSNPLILGTNSIKDTGFDVANSCRFNGAINNDECLIKTFGTATNRKKFTFSLWIKISERGQGDNNALLVAGAPANDEGTLGFDSNYRLSWTEYDTSTTSNIGFLRTNRVFRDFSAWYNLVFSWDTTNATADNRMKIWVNGVQETSFESRTNPSLNYDAQLNNNVVHNIGRQSWNNSGDYNGYMAEVCFIDGQALDPTSFGEFDEDTGIWKPIDVSGLTFGTNGFYLDFENSGSLGADVSGNGNNFTVNNLTSIDQTTDTPTNNFATLNPLHFNATIPSSGTLSDGNLTFTSSQGSGGYPAMYSTMAVSQGKWYAEFKVTTGNSAIVGIGAGSLRGGFFGGGYYDYAYYYDGTFYNNGGNTGSQSSYTDGDIISVAMDLDNNKVYVAKNNTWQHSGNPSAGTGGYTITAPASQTGATGTGVYHFAYGDAGGGTPAIQGNFGNPPYSANGYSDANGYGNMSYSVPSGYYILNTKNLAEYG